jgi:hypothetical protein
MPAAPEGQSKESQLKKTEDTDQTMESRDSSGPYPASETMGLAGKTENIVPEWLLEEELTVSIGLLWIWTHPSKLNEATHQRVQNIN